MADGRCLEKSNGSLLAHLEHRACRAKMSRNAASATLAFPHSSGRQERTSEAGQMRLRLSCHRAQSLWLRRTERHSDVRMRLMIVLVHLEVPPDARSHRRKPTRRRSDDGEGEEKETHQQIPWHGRNHMSVIALRSDTQRTLAKCSRCRQCSAGTGRSIPVPGLSDQDSTVVTRWQMSSQKQSISSKTASAARRRPCKDLVKLGAGSCCREPRRRARARSPW